MSKKVSQNQGINKHDELSPWIKFKLSMDIQHRLCSCVRTNTNPPASHQQPPPNKQPQINTLQTIGNKDY
jgi:hypothetical protein